MQISDYDAVIKLWRECDGISLREADSRTGISRYLERNPGLSFIAETGDQLVATLMAGHDGKRGYIQHLAVAEACRNNGIARHLVGHCLQALKAEGILKSHVHVLGDNQSGRQFWTALGWMHRAEIEMYSFINADNPNV